MNNQGSTLFNKEYLNNQQLQYSANLQSQGQLPPNNKLKGGNQILYSTKTNPLSSIMNSESAVKGRRLATKEVNVVCGVGSQDTFREMEMLKSYNGQSLKSLLTMAQEQQQLQNPQLVLNSNINNNNKRDRSEQSRDGSKSTTNKNNRNQQSSQDTHNSGGSNNAFKTRKSSTDSHGGANRQARFNQSQGRSEKKRGKSTSNSQSRGPSKNPHDQRIAGLNYQINVGKANQAVQNQLKRPNSAKNLKNVPSVASMQNIQKNLVNSPTQTNLRRETSTNQLPPKNPMKPFRNQTFQKLHMPLYQSVGSHPTSGHTQSSQSNSNSNKRAPSASSERKIIQTGSQLWSQRQLQPLQNNFMSTGEHNQQQERSAPFSPVRTNNRYHQESVTTMPTSGHKPNQVNSGDKNSHSRTKNRKLKQSNGKLKSPGPNIYTADQNNLNNLSPNIGRIRPDQHIINEELKEDSFTRDHQPHPLSSFDSADFQNLPGLQQNQNMNMFNIQFDPSLSTPNLHNGLVNQINSGALRNQESQDSSISLRMGSGPAYAGHSYLPSGLQNQGSDHSGLVGAISQNNLHQQSQKRIQLQSDTAIKEEIQRTLRQHLIQEEDKKRKKNLKNKENINKMLSTVNNQNAIQGQDQIKQMVAAQSQSQLKLGTKRMTQEQMKQLMEQKLQQSNMNLARKLKKPIQNHIKQIDQQQNEQSKKEQLEQKQRRQQSREQHTKQREELHEIRMMMQDTLKQPLKNSHSNSQTRKQGVEQQKSLQRPFSAKVGGDQNPNQQLLIKMPPVSMEPSSPYDIMNLQNSLNLQQNQQYIQETSPLRTNKYDHQQKGQALQQVASEFNLRPNDILLGSMTDQQKGLRTGKRDKSKRIKQQHDDVKKQISSNEGGAYQLGNNVGQQSTKALNAQLLKQKIEMKFDTFKNQFAQQLNKNKLKKGIKGMKSQKILDPTNNQMQQQQQQQQHQNNFIVTAQTGDERITRKGMQQRSKSKKRIDDEKENRRLSISPGREQRIGSKEARSGTKSRSEKKRKRKQKLLAAGLPSSQQEGQPKFSDTQYQNVKMNVIELLKQQNMMDQAKKLMRSSLEQKQMQANTQDKPMLNKNLKSQTVANLHQALQDKTLKKNQIQITKSMLKNLQIRKQSQKSSQSQSKYEVDKSSQNQQELSYNQIQQEQIMQNQFVNFYPQLDNHGSISTPNLINHNNLMHQQMHQNEYNNNQGINQNFLYASNDFNQKNRDGANELTPIIQGRAQKRNQQNPNINSLDQNRLISSQQMQGLGSDIQSKYSQGIRPIDSLQSFQIGPNFNINNLGSLSYSREDLSIFRSQDNNVQGRMNMGLHTDQQLIRIENNQQQPLEFRSLSNMNMHQNQVAGMRSRSGSIEHLSSTTGQNQQKQIKSNKKKKSNKKQKPSEQNIMGQKRLYDIQPVQLNLISPTKAQQQFTDNMNTRQNSGSKTRKSALTQGNQQNTLQQRKGSAGYKRNQIQHQQQPLTQMNTVTSTMPQSIPTSVTSKSGKQQQLNSQPGLNQMRPKSAAVQANAQVLDFLQQKKQLQQLKQQQNQDQFQFVKKFNLAVITVQKSLRRYLAKVQVLHLMHEKQQVERDLENIQQKYWQQAQRDQQNSDKFNIRSSIESQKIAPIRQLFTNEQQNIMQYNNNINILDEESKGGDGKMLNSNSIQNNSQNAGLGVGVVGKSFESSRSKLSQSEANLKSIIAKEAEKLKQQLQSQKQQSRPQSSDIQKNMLNTGNSNKVPRIGSAGANQSKNNQNVQILDAQSDKNLKIMERRASQQSNNSNANKLQMFDNNNDKNRIQDKQIQNKLLEKEIPMITRNLNDQFDSMVSINKLSEELNFKQENLGNKQDSFLKSLILNESYHQYQKQQQPPSQSSQYHKKLTQNKQSQQEQHLSQGINSNSQILNSEDKDMSWQFERKSFQDQYLQHNLPKPAGADNNKSQILQEEFKRQQIEAISASNTKAQIPNILNQYESYINDLAKKAEMGKQELDKYRDKMYLSPSSQKKKNQLEKWVEKQEQKIQQKRNFMNENMNDLISKMQLDIDMTKRKINMGSVANAANSARKESNGSLRFNVSHEISQIDMSLGHISNMSVNATPRIYNQSLQQIIGGNGPITAKPNPASNIISDNPINNLNTLKKQQDQSSSILSNNNRSNSVDQQNKQPTNKKLFDYKLASQVSQPSTDKTNAAKQANEKARKELIDQQQQLQQEQAKIKVETSGSLIKDQSQRSRISNLIDQNQSQSSSSKRSIKTEKSLQQNKSLTDRLQIDEQINKQRSLQNEKLGLNLILNTQEDGFQDADERSQIFRSDHPQTPNSNKQEQIRNQNDTNVNIGQNNVSNRFRESDIVTCSAVDETYPVDEDHVETAGVNDMLADEDQENESLSKMEPPQFQSPTMSAISPNQQLKDYFSEEDDKNAPTHPSQLPLRPFNLNKYDMSGNDDVEDEDIDREPVESTLSKNQKPASANSNLAAALKSGSIDQVNFSGPDSEREYSQAFLALKEPEHPITMEKIRQIREEKEERVAQTEILTDYILALLVEQMKYNMFPKRVMIMKSPIKAGISGDDSVNHTLLDSYNEKGIDILHNIIDEDIKQEDLSGHSLLQSLQSEEKALTSEQIAAKGQSPVAQVPKKKKIRGIKTTMRVVDQYIQQVFTKVKEGEDEFVENLSTPLNKDPLEILLHLQNAVFEGEMENAVAYQQSVLPVDLYLDIERKKQDVQAQDPSDEEDNAVMNKSMMGEWENIHNKVIFDGINEALDNFRPYGLRGPPMPWSQQTRTLTYKNGQQIDNVLKQVRTKVMEWARTFSGALPCSELLQEYGIKGPLDEDKLNLLREERLALVLAAEIEENEMLWTDYEYEETQSKLDVADMILEFLAEEVARDLNKIQQSRINQSSVTADTTEISASLNKTKQ